ncbi:hypothetical protein D3C85_522890 [compost metagenome]
MFNIGNFFTEHMNLFGIDAAGFQFGFNGFKIVEIVTDVIVSIHGAPPISCLLQTSSVLQALTEICSRYLYPWGTLHTSCNPREV